MMTSSTHQILKQMAHGKAAGKAEEKSSIAVKAASKTVPTQEPMGKILAECLIKKDGFALTPQS
ncbi:hypothetical protein [Legionella spiritensis]|uniref:hypothetical protein n=1 Tax=Legionella spiritensis TaxID=452 RepID=UPI000F83E800|nr:hypothetical protein [Legionella spiritensis]